MNNKRCSRAKGIWFINHYAVSPHSGGATRHYDFGKELIERGYDVTIFASSFDHKLRTEMLEKKEKLKKQNIDGVKFVWLRTYPYQKNDLYRVINMLSFAFRMFFVGLQEKKPDVIIASSPHPFSWIAGYFLARLKKSRFIAEARDLWPQSAIDMGVLRANSIVTKILIVLERFTYKKAVTIIVLMPEAEKYLTQLGINNKKISYIPNGVRIKEFDRLSGKVMSDDVSRIINKHKKNFKAVYLGAHGHANALDTLVDAAGIVAEKGYGDIHFLFIGDGPEKQRLINKVKESRMENIFFYPPIKKTDVPVLLKNVDLCLFSLVKSDVFKYGISPNKLFDYMCSGKLIIFSCETKNNIVKEAGAGIAVDAEEPNAIAQAVIAMFNASKEERIQMGLKGRKYLENNHDISNLVNRLESIL